MMLEKVIAYRTYSGFADVFHPYGAQDERPDLTDDETVHPIDRIWQAAPVNAAVKSANGASIVFDLALPPESDVDDDSTSPFYKSPLILQDDGRRTLKKRLGITRSEEVKAADGTVWVHGFDANSQLVDARVLLDTED
jgi:hypothetical protein